MAENLIMRENSLERSDSVACVHCQVLLCSSRKGIVAHSRRNAKRKVLGKCQSGPVARAGESRDLRAERLRAAIH